MNEVISDPSLSLDVFAYDLNEPDVISLLLKLASQGRIRVILDNASLHHNKSNSTQEDQFQKLFNKAAKKPSAILRGKFGRYAHDKVFIVSRGEQATKVLTGSTNLSITGVYVNSNHVIVFNDANTAGIYQKVFDDSWSDGVSVSFNKTPEAGKVFSFGTASTSEVDITFSPHTEEFATTVLQGLADRIEQEGKVKTKGSVLFAVMGIAVGGGPVLPALRNIHSDQDIFSYGISDAPGGIFLYTPRSKEGVLVTGKPSQPLLPPPFDQVPGVGAGHQVHHKFVVCGFNGSDPVVYCGSSNLTLGGEQENGDNLIAFHDEDIATAFAIEAVALVDHFDFLDRNSTKGKSKPVKSGSRQVQAQSSGWFLSTSDKWTAPYYDSNDLHCADRLLFGS